MLGLEHKIILVVGLEERGQWLPAAILVEVVEQHFLEIGLPAAKIVIYVNAWNPCVPSLMFQGRELFGHGEGRRG